MRLIICTQKSWNINLANAFIKNHSDLHQIELIKEKNELNLANLEHINPDYIFFPHWSFIIPSEIFERYSCVVFHMTDLPFGRGGSPLQNLISRGIYKTKISAIKVTSGLDTGPIYLKKDLDISKGSATEIFTNAAEMIFKEMIPEILEQKLIPQPQSGEPVVFKRRTPEESLLNSDFSLQKIYDYIRMLDAEGYPNAYLTFGDYNVTFTHAEMDVDSVTANVRISRQKKEETNV